MIDIIGNIKKRNEYKLHNIRLEEVQLLMSVEWRKVESNMSINIVLWSLCEEIFR